jgi:multidrug efflux pump subunit AcrB
MKITEFSIHHNMAVLVCCIGIVILGCFCYVTLPRESFPEIKLPFVMVTTVLDGGNPTDIEKSVTIPLETKLDGMEGLKEMRSVSSDSISMVSLEFLPEVETETALNRVRDAVDQAKGDISTEADEPVVAEVSLTNIPVLIYHLVGRGKVTASELNDLAEKLEDRIEQIPSVLGVDIGGQREREVIIEVDPERLHYYNLSLAQVEGILRGTNRNVSAGNADSASNRIVMRLPGEFTNPGEIFGLVIGQTPRGTPIYLRDLGTARYDFEDEVSRSRLYDFVGAGTDKTSYQAPASSVSLNIKKRTGENILELCEAVAQIMADYPLPEDVRIVKGLDQSVQVRDMVGDLENGIGTSLVLVLLVIFIGLGARNAFLVATAIPFSLLLSITIVKLMGETLNMMVLFSLILSLGMLVDNAIVIVENIYRHCSMGVPRFRAAILGTTEVAWPVITSTATTVGAFLPLMFWPGVIGQFMSYMPRTVIVVLLSSLFVALVINPTLASVFMKLKPGAQSKVDPESLRPSYWLVLKYQKALEFMLHRPVWTLVTAFAMLIGVFAMYAVFGAGTEFFPKVDPDTITCSIRPPEGISLEASDRLSQDLEARIFGRPGSGYEQPVQNLKYASVSVGLETGIGGMEGDMGPVNTQIEFVDRKLRTEASTETLKEMRQRIEGLDRSGAVVTHPLFGADFDVIRPQEGPPTGKAVSVDIFGEDLQQMARVIGEMKGLIHDTPGTVKPTDDASTAQPTLEWQVDRARAGMLGLDQASVGSFLQVAIGGLKVGTLGHGDDEQDIKLRLPEKYRLNTNLLGSLTIPVTGGGMVPLSSVANASLVPGPVAIKHLDRHRVLNASAEVQPGIRNDTDIRKSFQARARAHLYPPGISYQFGGSDKEQKEAAAFLMQAFGVAIFIILMVMVLQFNSLAISAIVMCSVLLSLMGVFIGLLILQAPFGTIMTGIGIISLAGVVVNNAIVLLDAIHQQEKQGKAIYDAVVGACMIRFRPVLLTAVTTILGLVPMALKLNWDFRRFTYQYDTSSSQWWQSMSLAVIFGLLVATVLTLGVVPTLYLESERLRKRLFPGSDRFPDSQS